MGISLIITCHNQERYLSDLLFILHKYCDDSNPIEIIIVDSSDSPIVGLENYNYEHIPNNGPSAARNFGAKKASHEWLVFCDADDVINPFIFTHLKLFEKEGANAYFFEYKKSYDDSIVREATAFFNSVNVPKVVTFKTITDPVLFSRKFFPVHAMLIEKKVLEKIKFKEDQWFIEDVRFYMELGFNKSLKLMHCNEECFSSFHRYFNNKQSLSNSSKLKFWNGVAANYIFASNQNNLSNKQKFDLLKILLLSYHSVDKEIQQILERDCKTIWNYFFGTGKLIKNKNIFKFATALTRSFK